MSSTIAPSNILIEPSAPLFALDVRDQFQRAKNDVETLLAIIPNTNTVATMATMRALSSALLTNGQIIILRGYNSDNDLGGGIFTWSSTSTSADNLGTIIRPDDVAEEAAGRLLRLLQTPVVTPQMFGAVGNNSNNDAPAIQAASDASKVVAFPPASYLLKNQITITNTVSRWVGLAGQYPQSTTVPGPRLIWHADIGTGNPMIVNQTSTSFTNIAFRGPAKGSETGIINRRVPGDISYEDTDVTVYGCNFTLWLNAISHYNRGLQLVDNTVAACTHAVRFYWDDANFMEDASNDYDGLPKGFRAIRILNNRFHIVSSVLMNIDDDAEYLRGLSVVGNQVDAGDCLFIGGLYSGTFSGNIVDQTADMALEFTTPVKDVSIVGNTFCGDTAPGNPPDQLIYFREGVSHSSITGNTFRGTEYNGILISGAMSYCTIGNNIFVEIGTPGDTTRACIRMTGAVTNVAINGNTFDPREDTYCIRGSTGQSWAGVAIQGNAWNRSRTLVGVYSDGGNNSVQS